MHFSFWSLERQASTRLGNLWLFARRGLLVGLGRRFTVLFVMVVEGLMDAARGTVGF